MATGNLKIEIGTTKTGEQLLDEAWAKAGLKQRPKLCIKKRLVDYLLYLGLFLAGFTCGGIFVVRLLQQG